MSHRQQNKYIIKTRESNMELLRIIAMVLVMVVHTGFVSLGPPTQQDILINPGISFYRFLSQSLSIVCVNLFVLLSGWYGIRVRKESFLKFIFQIGFFLIGGYLIFVLVSPSRALTIESGFKLFLLTPDNWFIKAYLLLYIISPILNSYINSSSQKQKAIIIVFFFLIQSLYGWLFPGMRDFSEGYTTISFVGLYLLANFVRNSDYGIFKFHRAIDLLIYLLISLFLTILSFTLCKRGYHCEMIYAYNNPLAILSSLYFFLFFSKLSFRVKVVNSIAASSFAIYLFHCNPFFFRQIYTSFISNWFKTQPFWIWLSFTFIFITIIFFSSILLDKIRIMVWEKTKATLLKLL